MIEFDPRVLSYERVLAIFFDQHKPTHRRGTQYRSAIFYRDEAQRAAAEKAIANQGLIVTDLEPLGPFFMAEEYHQKYFEKQRR
mmetsp:Transcript_1396/g.4399  ORF Transcript_1396/g.4399 Transcript_1396/m.4399 type:complete len:84 (-) Transcript_1396:316-567(-)